MSEIGTATIDMDEINITIVDNSDKPIAENDDKSSTTTEAIALTGLVIAEQPSMLSNLVYSNTLSSNDLGTKGQVFNQNAQNKLRIAILSNAINQVQNNLPLQARSAVDVLTNNELAQTITDFKAAMAAFADKKARS